MVVISVFYDSSDAQLKTVVVGSAADSFKASSAGPGTAWDGSTKAWAPGTAGTIKNLPVNFTQTFVLHLGSAGGITQTVAEWGSLLQAKTRSWKLFDLTLAKIG